MHEIDMIESNQFEHYNQLQLNAHNQLRATNNEAIKIKQSSPIKCHREIKIKQSNQMLSANCVSYDALSILLGQRCYNKY